MSATPLERIAAGHAALARLPAGDGAWADRRRQALEALLARGLPERRDENWRYLDHARLAEYRFDRPPGPEAAAGVALPVPLVPGARRIAIVDGRFDARRSDAPPDGVRIEDLAELFERDPAAADALLHRPGEGADERYALLADACAAGGLVIRVADGARPAEPLCLMHVATAAQDGAHHARIAIRAGAGSRLTLVEQFRTAGPAAALGNLAAEIALGRGAELVHLRLHEHAAAAAQVESWSVRQAAGSRYEQHLHALGGGLLRSGIELALEGRGAECRLFGLFLADGTRQVDLVTRVEHRAEETRTEQDYRGMAADRGRAAFNGRIVVQAGARGADASQRSRNLLLSPLAEVNARPQLEIHADEVRCSHGATIGSLDEAQLFYLQARGLDRDAARALLTFAFCRDVIGRLPLAGVRDAIESRVAAALPDRDLLREIA